MAKVKFTHQELNGSLGGYTFARNRGGSVVRIRSTPTNPQTARQLSVRAKLSTLSANWSNVLTAAQRSAWAAYAALHSYQDLLGNTVNLTGHQCYIQLNARLLDAGASAATDPPATAVPAALLTGSVTISGATAASLTFTATPLPAGCKIQSWMSMPGSAARNPTENNRYLIGYSTAAQASPLSLTLPKAVTTGQTVTFWFHVMDAAGQVSQAFSCKAVR